MIQILQKMLKIC